MTSKALPLRIDSPKELPNIGMSLCPGKNDPFAMTGPTERDLKEDITTIKKWGASLVVSLLENFELELLDVVSLGQVVRSLDMQWRHWPVMDGSALALRKKPCLDYWRKEVVEFMGMLDRGEKIFIHCRGGLGRTGTLAARILIQKGIAPGEAIKIIRLARPGAIETREQEAYLLARLWERQQETCLHD